MGKRTLSTTLALAAFFALAGAGSTADREALIEPLGAGTGVTTTVFSADRVADGLASVNVNTCLAGSMFDPAHRTPMQAAVLDYLRAGGFRHVRDSGFAPLCYNQAAYDAWWARVVKADGITRAGANGVGYSRAEIASLREAVPGLDALEFANEWDSARQPYNGFLKLAKPSRAGDTSIDLGDRNALHWTVPGQNYTLGDGPSAETVTLAAALPDSLSAPTLAAPLHADHAAGEPLRRVGDFVSDIADWYRVYAPALRAEQPGLKLLGPAMAHPVNNEKFVADGVQLGGTLDVLNAHPYPVNGDNPEGADGDGYRGSVGIDHPPCSTNHTSYTFYFNVTCENGRQAGPGIRLPSWITEYSYEVVPAGAAHSTAWQYSIPDDVAVDYLDGSEFFALTHGVSRLYWFQLADGTSGPASGFCPYGLIRDASCAPDYGATPAPKPELLGLMSLIAYFHDPACRYPSCGAKPSAFEGQWRPAALPLETLNARFADGRFAVAFWLGSKSYDITQTGPCAETTSCYVPVGGRSERFSGPAVRNARAVYVTGIDDDRRDPLPGTQHVTPADGLGAVSVVKCPDGPAPRREYGCILPLRRLTVSDGGVAVSASRELQWLVIEPH